MEKYDINEQLQILRERNDIKASVNYGTTHTERITIELLDLNYGTTQKLDKSTQDLIEMLKQFDASNTKLSKRMFLLTAATVFLAIVQVILGIISMGNH